MSTKTPFFPAHHIGILTGREIIGDGLIKLPFIRALRATWPEATIHWITTQDTTVYNGPLSNTVRPFLDQIHECPAWAKNKHAKPSAPPLDLLIDTRGRWKLALQARRTLPHKLFIAPAFRFLFSDRRPALCAKRPAHILDRLMQTIALAAGEIPQVTSRLPIDPDLLAKARRIMPEDHLHVGFAPGAGNAIKKWPLAHFEKVAQLQARMNRVPVFILGPQEMDIYDHLHRAVPEAVFPLQAHEVWGSKKPSVDQTLAIGSCLDLAVTNDSGTSHMLAAVDCPLVSLFGPTSATKLAPKVSNREVLSAQTYGSEDMAAIPVEAVHEAVNRLMLALKKV